MAELEGLFAFLREKSDEDVEIRTLCKAISKKYLEKKEMEARDQCAREENIVLKIDVDCLESILDENICNKDALAELDRLLMEFDKEHFKALLDIDYIMDKLQVYERITSEMESRDTSNTYQELYLRKLNIAKKLEQRYVVKKYRQNEQERINTRNKRLRLEEKARQKSAEIRAMSEEVNKYILSLLRGTKDLEASKANKISSNGYEVPAEGGPNLHSNTDNGKVKPQTRGLSSRLHLVFNEFQTPSVVNLSMTKIHNEPKGHTLLFRQANILRRVLQNSIDPITDVISKATEPLKVQTENKLTEEVPSAQYVEQKIKMKRKTKNDETTLNSKRICVMTDHNYCLPSPVLPKLASPAQQKLSDEVEPENQEIAIDPPKEADSLTILNDEPNLNNKQNAVNGEVAHNPLKRGRCTPVSKYSKSFMDMFLEFSKDSLTPMSSPRERENDTNNVIISAPKRQKIEILENKILKPPDLSVPQVQVKAKKNDSKPKAPDQPKANNTRHTTKSSVNHDQSSFDVFTTSLIENDNKIKAKPKQGRTVSVDEFENFFSEFVNTGTVGSDFSDNPEDISFNFMEANENAGENGDDDDLSSFQL